MKRINEKKDEAMEALDVLSGSSSTITIVGAALKGVEITKKLSLKDANEVSKAIAKLAKKLDHEGFHEQLKEALNPMGYDVSRNITGLAHELEARNKIVTRCIKQDHKILKNIALKADAKVSKQFKAEYENDLGKEYYEEHFKSYYSGLRHLLSKVLLITVHYNIKPNIDDSFLEYRAHYREIFLHLIGQPKKFNVPKKNSLELAILERHLKEIADFFK